MDTNGFKTQLSDETRLQMAASVDKAIEGSQLTMLLSDPKFSNPSGSQSTINPLRTSAKPVKARLGFAKDPREIITREEIDKMAINLNVLGPRATAMSPEMLLHYDAFIKTAKDDITGCEDRVRLYLLGARSGSNLEKMMTDLSLTQEIKAQGKMLMNDIPPKLATIVSYTSQINAAISKLDKRLEMTCSGIDGEGKFIPMSIITKTCLELPVKGLGSLNTFMTQHPKSPVLAAIMKKPVPYMSGTPADRLAIINGIDQAGPRPSM